MSNLIGPFREPILYCDLSICLVIKVKLENNRFKILLNWARRIIQCLKSKSVNNNRETNERILLRNSAFDPGFSDEVQSRRHLPMKTISAFNSSWKGLALSRCEIGSASNIMSSHLRGMFPERGWFFIVGLIVEIQEVKERGLAKKACDAVSSRLLVHFTFSNHS